MRGITSLRVRLPWLDPNPFDDADLLADLNVTYRKPVPTPGPLLCTAKIEREEGNGRKLFIQTTLGDGNGTIFTSAEALFVKATAML